MGVGEWFHHFFNPHCEECAEREQLQDKCKSCESLREQLYYMQNLVANLQHLLTKAITNAHTELPAPTLPEEIKPIQTRHVPFRVKREALESEARETARILKQRVEEINKAGLNVKIPTHPAPATTDDSTDDLEVELGIAEAEREAQSGESKG